MQEKIGLSRANQYQHFRPHRIIRNRFAFLDYRTREFDPRYERWKNRTLVRGG